MFSNLVNIVLMALKSDKKLVVPPENSSPLKLAELVIRQGQAINPNYAATLSLSQIPAYLPFPGRRLSQGWPTSALKDTSGARLQPKPLGEVEIYAKIMPDRLKVGKISPSRMMSPQGGISYRMASKKDWGPIQSGEVWWILAEPLGENGGEELQTFELFCTKKDAKETLKIFQFGESCRPVSVEIKILA